MENDDFVSCGGSIINIIVNSSMSLKDFVIVAKLGEGAYSSVYKVQRIVDSQIYALKKVKMNNLSDKEQENALN
jgi:NIMA (never in mitosis gene a)-related kinase